MYVTFWERTGSKFSSTWERIRQRNASKRLFNCKLLEKKKKELQVKYCINTLNRLYHQYIICFHDECSRVNCPKKVSKLLPSNNLHDLNPHDTYLDKTSTSSAILLEKASKRSWWTCSRIRIQFYDQNTIVLRTFYGWMRYNCVNIWKR